MCNKISQEILRSTLKDLLSLRETPTVVACSAKKTETKPNKNQFESTTHTKKKVYLKINDRILSFATCKRMFALGFCFAVVGGGQQIWGQLPLERWFLSQVSSRRDMCYHKGPSQKPRPVKGERGRNVQGFAAGRGEQRQMTCCWVQRGLQGAQWALAIPRAQERGGIASWR